MIKIALYKRRKGFFNNAIYYWQSLLRKARKYRQYTHVEVVVNGIWYTSSYNGDGIRKRMIDGNNGHWDFHTIETTLEQDKLIAEWFNKRLERGYDWYGILLSQVLPLNIEHPKKWFCSEAVYASLVYAKVIPKGKQAQWYSPARLTQYIKTFKRL